VFRRTIGSVDARYLPWDELRFRPTPDGLTPEQWWSVVRFRRSAELRPLPLLRDKEGVPFSYVLADPVLEAVDRITRGASGHISISADVTNAATRDRYVISSLMEEAITSSQLEGAVTSRRVAKDMLRSGRSPKNRSERMIVNNFAAMQRIAELRDTPLSPALVCDLHRIVTAGTLDRPERAGRIQDDDTDRVRVWNGDDVLHEPPPVAELAARLQRLCDFANNDDPEVPYLHPVLRAIAVHFMCGYDHYFDDGNGRTARALFYWVMLREGYWLAEFLTISKLLKAAPSRYARAYLLTEGDAGDLTHFFLFNLSIINRAVDALHEYLAVKADEVSRVQLKLAGRHDDFNHRQVTVLEHALRKPGFVYTVASHSRSHHVSGETARKDLTGLVDAGLMIQSRRSKHYAWVAVDDLAQRLTS
jgi:Fic family protein